MIARIAERTRRIAALIRKEMRQIRRDPSAFLIAGVLPPILLFLFGTGVSLDLKEVRIAVVVEQSTPEANSLLEAYVTARGSAEEYREYMDDIANARNSKLR